jgi:hypothetical protein
MISAFHAGLEMAAREGASVELDRWEQGSLLWNTVSLTKGESFPHRPDALFSLRFPNAPEGQQRSNFVYEADRETSNLTRIRQKLFAHLAFFSQARHVERYGFRKLRAVLVETLSVSRREQMKQLAEELAATDSSALICTATWAHSSSAVSGNANSRRAKTWDIGRSLLIQPIRIAQLA